MKYLDENNKLRSVLANRYSELLANIKNIQLPVIEKSCDCVWHLYVIQVDNRDDLLAALHDAKIFAGIHYPIPIHLLGAYKDELSKEYLPVTTKQAGRILSLPLYPEMTFSQQRDYGLKLYSKLYPYPH